MKVRVSPGTPSFVAYDILEPKIPLSPNLTSSGRQLKPVVLLQRSPKEQTMNHCCHNSPLRACPWFSSLVYITIIELISKENRPVFIRERRYPPKAKIMTVCSLQETLFKSVLPLVEASACFWEEFMLEKPSTSWRRSKRTPLERHVVLRETGTDIRGEPTDFPGQEVGRWHPQSRGRDHSFASLLSGTFHGPGCHQSLQDPDGRPRRSALATQGRGSSVVGFGFCPRSL